MTKTLNIVARCTNNFKKVISYSKYNPFFDIYFLWFRKDFLHEQINFVDEELDNLLTPVRTIYLQSEVIMEYSRVDKIAFEQNSGVVHISFEKHDLGIILSSNRGIDKLLGFPKGYLVNKNVDVLMPSPVAEIHQKILEQLFFSSRFFCSNNQVNSYAKHFDGHLVKVGIFYKMVINLKGSIMMVGVI